jgi:hypothetical protein
MLLQDPSVEFFLCYEIHTLKFLIKEDFLRPTKFYKVVEK